MLASMAGDESGGARSLDAVDLSVATDPVSPMSIVGDASERLPST